MNLEQLKKNIENDSNLNKYLRGVGKKSDNTQCIIFEDNKWLVFYYIRTLNDSYNSPTKR